MPLDKNNTFDPLDNYPVPSMRSHERRDTPPSEGNRGGGEANALLARLAQEVATLRTALDASRQRVARLELEAAEDPVSGLLNQRALKREIAKAIDFNARYRAGATLALISADGMGGVAERHGQRVCCRVLRTLGDRLRGAIRSCDVAARIEPYRFAVVMGNGSAADCERRLELIRTALGGMDRLLEGRVAAIRIRTVAVPILDGDDADSVLARGEALLEQRPARAVRR